jgi:hypothetical protein
MCMRYPLRARIDSGGLTQTRLEDPGAAPTHGAAGMRHLEESAQLAPATRPSRSQQEDGQAGRAPSDAHVRCSSPSGAACSYKMLHLARSSTSGPSATKR